MITNFPVYLTETDQILLFDRFTSTPGYSRVHSSGVIPNSELRLPTKTELDLWFNERLISLEERERMEILIGEAKTEQLLNY